MTIPRSNGGIGTSNGRSVDTQTVLTSLTGDSVTVTTGANTKLSGAVIAATDNQGNDTGKLNLTTNTLTTENLTDTHYNTQSGFSVGANIGLSPSAQDPKPDTKNTQTPSGTKINSEHLAFNTSTDTRVGKTLATVGEGHLTIGDTQHSTTTTNLNRDVTKVNQELYSSTTGTNVDATIDNRMFTEEGRKHIAEDFLKTGMLVGTLAQIATNSTIGIGDFNQELLKRDTTYEAIKQRISSDPTLSQQLTNTAYTDEQKNAIINGITNEVLAQLGYQPTQVKLIATTEAGRDNQQVAGYYSLQTSSIYVNDPYNNNNYQLLQTSATEAQRSMDAQKGSDFQQDQAYRNERSLYSQNFGNYVADYTNFALGQSDQGSLSTQINQPSTPTYVTMTPSVLNNDVANNNLEFVGLDKKMGDNKIIVNKNLSQIAKEQIVQDLQKLTNNKLFLNANSEVISTHGDKTDRPKGTTLLERLINSPFIVTIKFGTIPPETNPLSKIGDESNGQGTGSNISYEQGSTTNSDVKVQNDNGDIISEVTPNYILLGHELIHADHAMRGVWINNDITYNQGTNQSLDYQRKEEIVTVGIQSGAKNDITENDLRDDHGLSHRVKY